ncbi:MAG: glycoside hydrolase family 18 protein [Terracidiphilus sp.]
MSRTRICAVIIALWLPIICMAAVEMPHPIVVGYVFPQDAALAPGQIDPHSVTRINYAFANIRNGRMVTGFASDKQNFAYLTGLRKQNPSFTVLVSVGGWLWSASFSDVALTAESRSVFIESVMDFIARYDLDGLDVDWEYPGMAGAGHRFRSEDRRNFTLLLKELRKRFDQETGKSHRRLYLTIAAGAGDDFLVHTEMKKVQEHVDTVNLMAYDYVEPGDDPLTGHHAPLFGNPADVRNYSDDASVRAFEQAGVPAGKILLGVPFYGHVWGEVADRDHGFLEPGKAVPNAYATYGVITGTMLNQGFVRYWDPIASAPYLYNSEKHIFVSFDDPESIAAKCRYVVSHKLGGVMFWEYSGDPAGVLLGAINQSLSSPAPAARN